MPAKEPPASGLRFGFANLFRFVRLWLASIRWTPRRALIVVAFFVVYPLFELLIWAALLLDQVWSRAYRSRKIVSPVFVVGNFRSGTTLLHRLLAADADRFTTMKMWEVLFAPSVTQRRIVDLLAAFDRRIGSPIRRLFGWIESFWHEKNVMHEVSLSQPEEDEYLLLHIWSTLTIGLSSGLLDEATPYVYFDTEIPHGDRDRIMSFYIDCLKRHLYVRDRGTSRQYLAKNPALTPKIDSLFEYCPDAKLIYLVRNPLEVIPSFVSMMKFSWKVMGAPTDGIELRDFILDMAGHWYRYPLERLAQMPESSYVIVVYDDLVRDPGRTVRQIYRHFDFDLTAEFERELATAVKHAVRYQSRHEYSLEELGLTREQIVAEFDDVFARFGFSTTSTTAGD